MDFLHRLAIGSSLELSIFVVLTIVSVSQGEGVETITLDSSDFTSLGISWTTSGVSTWDYFTVDIVKDASGYNVWGFPKNISSTSIQVDDLTPDQSYTITVTPWTNDGSNGTSLADIFGTVRIPEGYILVSDVKSYSAFLQWGKYPGRSVFLLSIVPPEAVQSPGYIVDHQVELTIIMPGTVFNVTLLVANPPDYRASTLIRSAPETIRNISVVSVGRTDATISFTPPDSPHDAYEVYLSSPGLPTPVLAYNASRRDGTFNVTVAGLNKGTDYTVEVGTVLYAKESFEAQRSERIILSAHTLPLPEGFILVSNVTSSSAFLQWGEYPGVVVSRLSIVPPEAVESPGLLPDRQVELTILMPGTVFSVTLLNANLENLASILIRSAPEAIRNISVVSVGSTDAIISLTPPDSPHDAYEVYLSSPGLPTPILAYNASRRNGTFDVTVPGLTPDTNYTVDVGTVLYAKESFEAQRSERITLSAQTLEAPGVAMTTPSQTTSSATSRTDIKKGMMLTLGVVLSSMYFLSPDLSPSLL